MGDSFSATPPVRRRLDPAAIRQIEREIATLRQHLTRMRNRPELADARTLRTYEEMIEQRLQLLPRTQESTLKLG
jgi:shikimate kinase